MSVCIIGAGLAGLACAYRLKKSGVDVRIFDSGVGPGGRSTVERHDGFLLDVGAQYLLGPEVFRTTFDLIQEIGMVDDLLPIRPTTGQLYRGTVFHQPVASVSGLLHFKGLNILDKALLPKMALMLSRHGGTLDVKNPVAGISHDTESVAAFIRREFSQNILNYVAGPLISTLFFYGSHETSKLLYLLLARHMYNTVMYTLRGGIGSLSLRLAEHVDVHVRSRVDAIHGADHGFEVRGARFSDVIVSVPGDAVLSIAGLKEMMSEEDQAFFQSCAYQRAVSVFVATDRPVDGRCFGVSIPSVEKRRATAIAFHDFMDPSRVPEGAGLLAITGGGPDITADDLLDDLQTIYPVLPRFSKAYEWDSAMAKFPPGRFRDVVAFNERQRKPGLFFCGDYLLGPYVEGAILSGYTAADRVIRRRNARRL